MVDYAVCRRRTAKWETILARRLGTSFAPISLATISTNMDDIYKKFLIRIKYRVYLKTVSFQFPPKELPQNSSSSQAVVTQQEVSSNTEDGTEV